MSGQAPGLLLGTKYQPALCYLFVFKILFLIVIIFFTAFHSASKFWRFKIRVFIFSIKSFPGFF